MTDLATRLNALPPERRQAFLTALRANDSGPAEPTLQRLADPPDGQFPLSLQQEQLWVFEEAFPDRSTYVVPLRISLRGPLDVARLRRALRQLLVRHTGLRTEITAGADGPVQRIRSLEQFEPMLALPVEDLQAWPAEDREGELARIEAAEAVRPFDLSRAPLLRLRLLRCGPQRHELLLVVHHIVFDGWSNAVLVRDLRSAYEWDGEGSTDDAGVRYVDFARWQRGWIDGAGAQASAEHWRRTLAGVAPLVLPVDRPYPDGLTFDGATECRHLAPGLMARVENFARSAGTTPFVPLLAAVQAVLHRTTGQRDILLGSALSNRHRPELRDLVGCLVNVVPLRANLAGDPTLRQLVDQDRRVVLDALDHQELPLERIVDAVAPPRMAHRLPLVQATFTMQTVQDAAAEADTVELQIRSQSAPNGGARFELAVEVGTDPSGRDYLNAEFNTQLFTPETIRRLLEHIEVLLDAAVREPDRPLSDTPMLGATEYRQVTEDWNPPPTPRPAQTIGDAFDQVAAAAADRVAVIGTGDDRLTYGQLAAQADAFAGRLRAAGVLPEDRVGMLLDRSPTSIAALLGVLKAGGAYVAVDPSNPAGRIVTQLRSAGVRALVASENVAGAAPDGDWTLITTAQDLAGPGAGTGGTSSLRPENLAYVLFTSGSTGGPKGVAIEHRSVVNFAATVRERFRLGADDRVLQFAPLTFDVSVFEIFGSLLAGAGLVLCAEADRRDPDRLADRMAAEAVTVIDLPPAVMSLLDPARFPQLRIAFVGGEAFSGDLTTRWAATGCEFYNGYGPTETTVTVIARPCPGEHHQSPPIGQAMTNHRAYVLDAALRPVPIGVAGDLYVAGTGMARGYHDRPGLTAAAFVPDPVSGVPGGRLYRTGDIARWLRTGELEFIGRSDRQIQLHGLRIEIGEVEEALARHPAVRQAVVEVRYEGADRYLAAYLCGDAAATSVAEVRQFVADQLPAYMVPHRLGWLSSIPLTSSGKVDRAALPSLAGEDDVDDGAAPLSRPPRPGTEQRVTDELRQILGLDGIGAEDNLFALGGTSLQLMRALARIRSVFGVRVPSADFYAAPTVAHLAAVVDSHAGRTAEPSFADLVAGINALSDDEARQRLEATDVG